MSKEAFIAALKRGVSMEFADQIHIAYDDELNRLTPSQIKEIIIKEFPEYYSREGRNNFTKKAVDNE